MIRIVSLLLIVFIVSCKDRDKSDIQVTTVKKGVFREELTDQGTIEAVNSVSVSAPAISYRYGALKIARIVDDGSELKQGDTIMIFDPSEIKRSIVQAEQQLEIARAEYEKLKSTQGSELEDLEADLELARIAREISAINFETSAYEPEATRKEIKLKLESASIALERAKEQIENKKVIHREDLVQKSLAIKQLTSTLSDANRSLNLLTVVSPVNGIAIKEENWSTGQKWSVGDQPYPGSNIIELPDLSEMRAEVKVSEVDVSKVVPGQKVEIRLDAYSDSVYAGTVESVANLAQNKDYKSKIKVFPVKIRIAGRSKAILPGLSVSCRIIVSEINDVIYIPLEALFTDPAGDYVWLKSGTGFKRRDVRKGAINTDFAIITEGLEEKDALALSDPFLQKEEEKGKKPHAQNGVK
jgi:RND family efflux transporter MFP subunit